MFGREHLFTFLCYRKLQRKVKRHMGSYTTIFWDLDQTLLDFSKSQDYALRFCFQKLNLPIDADIVKRYAAINDSYWERLELGEIDKEEVKLGRFRTLFDELHITQYTARDISEMYQETLGSVAFFLEDADKIVAKLKEMGYRQYIVTNGVNATQDNKMKLSGLNTLVDGVFVSELLGYPKPRKEYFDACFALLPDTGRSECILVGDSLTSDMRGANNAGIAACWYNPQGKDNRLGVKIDYEIRHLQDIYAVLGC